MAVWAICVDSLKEYSIVYSTSNFLIRHLFLFVLQMCEVHGPLY